MNDQTFALVSVGNFRRNIGSRSGHGVVTPFAKRIVRTTTSFASSVDLLDFIRLLIVWTQSSKFCVANGSWEIWKLSAVRVLRRSQLVLLWRL